MINPIDWIKKNFGEAFCISFVVFLVSFIPIVVFWQAEMLVLFFGCICLALLSFSVFVSAIILYCMEETRKKNELAEYRKKHGNESYHA